MFCCKGMRLANYLIGKGANLVRIDCNHEKKGFLVFIFEDNNIIAKGLESWKNDKNTYDNSK